MLTEGDKRDWEQYAKRVLTIPNPLTYYPEQIPIKDTSCRILSVGRLTYQKGFDMLVDAFAIIASAYPQWHIDIYGNGEDKEKLIHQIDKYNLQRQIRICSPTENIYHVVDILYGKKDEIKDKIKYDLSDYKIATHHGCHYCKVHYEDTSGGVRDPNIMDELIEECGCKTIGWYDHKRAN